MFQRKTKTAWLFILASLLSLWVAQAKFAVSATDISLLPQSKPANNSTAQDIPELKFGETLTGELLPGQTLRYAVKLAAGDFVELEMIVQNEGAGLLFDFGAQLVLYDPAGAVFYREFRFARQVTAGWRQPLKRLVNVTGTYRLEATARPKQKKPTNYQVRLAALRPATEEDRTVERAESLYRRAEQLGRKENKLEEALELGEKALTLYQNAALPDTIEIADLAMLLADIYGERNYYRDQERQEELHRIAIQNREAIFGPINFHVASLYSSLGTILNPVQAEKAFGRALEILIQTDGPESEYVPLMITSVGDSYERMGDKERAFEMYERAIRLREKRDGLEHGAFTELINWGTVLMERRNWQQAEATYQHALRAIARWANKTGTNPSVANGIVLDCLTQLFQRQGNFQRSDEYQQEWLAALKSFYPPFHRGLAAPYRTRGRFLIGREQYEAAAQQFIAAQQVLEQISDSPELAELLRDWQRLYLLTGRTDDAIAAQQRAANISENELKRLLVQGSEYEMLRMLKTYADETNETLALHALAAPESHEALELAFTTTLQRKGRALDEMNKTIAHIRNSADQESAALLQQLIDHYSQVSLLQTRAPEEKDLVSHQLRLKQLQQETEQLEVTLSQRNARFRVQVQPVTLSAVQQALPAGAALVEFARFNPKDPKTQEPLGEQYVAYLLFADGTLRWASLGKAEEIEAAVRDWLSELGKAPTPTSAPTLRRLARRLDALVMQPVRAQLGTTRHVLLAPDGALNLVPFAALVDASGRELVRDYLFSYLTSGRDLLRLQVKHQSADDVLVFAAPDYNDGSDATNQAPNQATNPSKKDERRGRVSQSRSAAALGKWEPLKFAEAEARAIQQQLPQAKLYLGKQASEAALKQVHRPRILHVVTHGAFLEDQAWEAQQGRKVGDTATPSVWENPLLRSWLALAGANQRKSGDEDGILTAYEAAALDLWGTKLVVLSACETGLGKLHNGEGVYGMRRALALAGAETQLTSLWKVNDRVTRKLMQSYYAKLAAGVGRAEALRQVQLEMLKSKANASPYYWAAFISIGEWANLDGVRK